jgi:hypothetical protein
MSQNTFNSFKELLIKKDLSDESVSSAVDYKCIADIFYHCSPEAIQSNAKHFCEEEQSSLKKFLKKLKKLESKPTLNELESLCKEALSAWSDKSLASLSELMREEAKDARVQAQRIEKLAKKYQPKDSSEDLAELQTRVKELQMDIVDIEMNLMQMEKGEQQNTERYKKTYNARERRRQVMQRLEKQIQGIQKKSKQNSNK